MLPGSFPVSVSVASDEIRAEALIWDTDRDQNHVRKVPSAGRVWKRLVLIRKSRARPATKPINTRTFLIIKGDLVLNNTHGQVRQQQPLSACTEDVNPMSSQGVLKDKKPSGPVDAIG